jgi:hypothetical protein
MGALGRALRPAGRARMPYRVLDRRHGLGISRQTAGLGH